MADERHEWTDGGRNLLAIEEEAATAQLRADNETLRAEKEGLIGAMNHNCDIAEHYRLEAKALRAKLTELEGRLEIMTREREHFARDNVALRTRLNAVDALLASEEPPEGLVDAVANEVTPDTAAQTAWRWFREQLRAPVYVGVDLASKPDFTVERIAAAPPAEPQEES